ncbi:DUF1000-domain-containing protein, partial [Rhizodiscina lignyota]
HSHEHDHGDDHDHGQPSEHTYETTPANLLYEQLDFPKVTTLNEDQSGSGEAILKKTWAERLDPEPLLESDADEQILMTVPFTGQVRLQSILLRSSDSPSAPSTLKVFINRDDLDFSSAEELSATQEFELARTNDIQEYPVKRALFNNTRSLSLFFTENFGQGEEDVTHLYYVAFKGEFMKLSKEPVSFLYEAAANPADHKPIVSASKGV